MHELLHYQITQMRHAEWIREAERSGRAAEVRSEEGCRTAPRKERRFVLARLFLSRPSRA